ncbi:CbtB domain-containing protein [Phytohabitans suffuscus]|uniref:Cobalt transporter n=1 Tax=Phytohabitans suffuscus TaxID=624315 RepID=A0A6F8YSA4_9ACTN|nr:CbtB-domain containing protein [Phytohabitans suffuscus]BCB88939.1 hypothetical protein Psuf_062520 [Phytohabitans suffuscus]
MAAPEVSVTAIRVPVTAWLIVAFALLAVFVLLQLNSTAFAEQIHEFTHDGRHALGVPCH